MPLRARGRAERPARARQQASEGNARLGLLLHEVPAATREAVGAWRRGAPAFALARYIEDLTDGA